MNKWWLIFAIIFLPILLFVFSFNFSSFAQNTSEIKVRQPTAQEEFPAFAADQIIVKFKPNVPPQAIEALNSEHGASEVRRSSSGGFVTLSLPEGSNVVVKAEIFNRNPIVEYAHPNFFAQAHLVPNDTFYCFQWHYDDSTEWNSTTEACQASAGNPFGGANGGGVGMEPAWDIVTASSTIIVAVLDSGAAYEDFNDPNNAGCYRNNGTLRDCRPTIDTYFQASDLVNTNFLIINGSDFVNSDDHPNDDNSHGTHVIGTVAQSTNNSLGVAGLAFGVTVMPVKVLDSNGTGQFDEIADAIRFAADNGADIINMSLGSEFDAQVMEDAVEYAFNLGVLVVTSAGNDFQTGNDTQFPAAYDSFVMAVGGTSYDETRAPYSSTGTYVDIAAPGGNTSEDLNNDGFVDGVLQQTFDDEDPSSDFAYWFFQGTSMASPHVAALAALILSVDNSLTPTQIRDVIESTAEDKGTAGRDDEYGFGIIDANAALSSLTAAVSITLATDGSTPFDIVALGATVDTTSSGTDDVQTIDVDTGPADLSVKSTNFSDGTNSWSLSATSSADQVAWDFSGDGTTWANFSSANTLFSLENSVAQGESRNLYLRLTMPTSTSSNLEYASTVTIVATQP